MAATLTANMKKMLGKMKKSRKSNIKLRRRSTKVKTINKTIQEGLQAIKLVMRGETDQDIGERMEGARK